VPTKTFAFDDSFDEVHLVLFGAYMQASALAAALRAIVDEGGLEVSWATDMLKELDLQVAKAIRRSNIGPSDN